MERHLRRRAARSGLRPPRNRYCRSRHRRPRLLRPLPQQSGPLRPVPAGGPIRHPRRSGHRHRHLDHAADPGRQRALRGLRSAQIRQCRNRGHPHRVPQSRRHRGKWVDPGDSFRRGLPGDANARKYRRSAVARGIGAQPRSVAAHHRRRSPAARIVASAPANRDRAAVRHHGTGSDWPWRASENLRRRRFWRASEPDAGGRFHHCRTVRDFSESCRRHIGSFLGRGRNHQRHSAGRMCLDTINATSPG